MPDRQRQPTQSASPTADSSQEPPALQADPAGNAAAASSINGQVPNGVDLRELGLNLQIPGGRTLEGGWNQLETQESGTTVVVRMSARTLTISFNPPLLVDTQWPASDVEV